MLKFKLLNILGIIIILLSVISLGIFIIINIPFLYYLSILIFHIDINSHKTISELMNNYYNIVTYLQSPFINHFSSSFIIDRKGFHHFFNVKQLIIFNNLFMFFSLPIALKVYYNYVSRKFIILWMNFLKLTIYTFIFMLILLAIDFNGVFIKFHQIFFKNNDWIFNVKQNSVILAFPDGYFFLCSLTLFCLFIFLCIFLLRKGKKEI
ncbi:TIGR01906 family membrane protein [Apilactobacillus quenuiae]|uniref:TIGR01906 family membrane protein n=1 Tax=Apilactobacillus quenuiae TaxID=2008377 RepID=UPI0012FFDB09